MTDSRDRNGDGAFQFATEPLPTVVAPDDVHSIHMQLDALDQQTRLRCFSWSGSVIDPSAIARVSITVTLPKLGKRGV